MSPEPEDTLKKLETALSIIDEEESKIEPNRLLFLIKIAANQLFIKARKLKATRIGLREAMGLSTPREVAKFDDK